MGNHRLAPEWARQDAVMLVWPHSNSDWNNQLDDIEKTYIELSRYISRSQKVILVAYDLEHIERIQTLLSHNGIPLDNILLIDIHCNDTWVRDFGPIFITTDNHVKMLDFTFDGWGNKFNHDHDNQFNKRFKQKLNSDAKLETIDFVLEAGNLDINSQGALLCSSSPINRTNKHGSKMEDGELRSTEQKFQQWLGCTHTLWLHDVKLEGDDTDGHIDTLARFCNDEIITYTANNNASDANHNAIEHLNQQLELLKNNNSIIKELVPLPLPQPIFQNGKQLPASYANFLITNHKLFVPVFNDKQDNYALKIFDDLFPTHEVIDIESTALIKQYGGIHCATMQIPEGFLN